MSLKGMVESLECNFDPHTRLFTTATQRLEAAAELQCSYLQNQEIHRPSQLMAHMRRVRNDSEK